ncbi:MAG: agmatinase [Alphaproteobacteria bacterium]
MAKKQYYFERKPLPPSNAPAAKQIDGGDQAFRASENLGRNLEQTWAGALSFCRRRYSRDLKGVDVAVSGIPLDLAVTYRPGTRLGPRGVRAASVQLAELDAHPFRFDPFSHLAVVDYGDCELVFDHADTIPASIEDHIYNIISQGVKSATIGGDHFITYPILRAHHRVHGQVALLQFDAHPDTWPDDGKQMNHGTMFTRAIQDKLIIPEKSLQVGIRTVAPEYGIKTITADEVHDVGVAGVLKAIGDTIGDTPCYLTFDIDCLDPSHAPGTGTPVAGGLTSREALKIIRGFQTIKGLNIVGCDMVEVSPPFDISEITSLAGAHILHDIICQWAWQKIDG